MEDCLFKVPRGPLEAESIIFRDMFLLPQGDTAEIEGLNDENPVVLKGIRQDEFEQLLTVLLSRSVLGSNISRVNNRIDQQKICLGEMCRV